MYACKQVQKHYLQVKIVVSCRCMVSSQCNGFMNKRSPLETSRDEVARKTVCQSGEKR